MTLFPKEKTGAFLTHKVLVLGLLFAVSLPIQAHEILVDGDRRTTGSKAWPTARTCPAAATMIAIPWPPMPCKSRLQVHSRSRSAAPGFQFLSKICSATAARTGVHGFVP